MQKLVVHGQQKLSGTLPISGSKNTALPLMAAAMLGGGKSTIASVPNLKDVRTFARVIAFTGVDVTQDLDAGTVTVDASNIDEPEAPYELVKRMRASFYMMGALLGRCGEARVSLPGGCAWGPRPVNLHIDGFRALGAEVELDKGYVVARAPGGRLKGGKFKLTPSSVGATINLLLGAVTASGSSRIDNAASEPDVVVFGEYLNRMGARISGLGTAIIEVEGVDRLEPADFRNCPDRIELGTFMIAAAMASAPGYPVSITGGRADHLGAHFIDAFAQTGAYVDYSDDVITVGAPETIEPVSIATAVYPGFPTDLQAQWTVFMTQANGNAKITDDVYTDRFKHIPELRRMGLNAIVVGNEVVVEGHTQLSGAHVMSTDLRASVSLVLAGMVAEGETHVQRVYHLDRGYENLEGKLSQAGVAIERVTYDEFADPEHEPTHA
jgi:UDP-N-acetylglucosamine 1-carboxyvinyltransferase